MDERPGNNDPIHLRHDNEKDAGAQVDASLYKLAATFGSVAFPPNMPDWLQQAILDGAELNRRTSGDFIRGEDTETAKQQKRKEAQSDELNDLVSAVEAAKERERIHEQQWMQTTHTYAGRTLSGEEWKQMMDWFDDPENAEQWEDAMMAETEQSRAEVRQTGGKMKRFYDLMGKDAKGTLTKDERREFDVLGKDNEVRRGVEVQKRIQDARAENGYDQTAQTEARQDATQGANASAQAALFADNSQPGSRLAAVPSLKPTYEAALAATAQPPPPLKPVEIAASNRVQVAPDNMFG